MMLDYNLMGEVSAFFIAFLFLISLFKHYDDKKIRTNLLKVMYIAVMTSIFFTVTSTYAILEIPVKYPVPIIKLLNIVYFMIVPSCSLFYTLYILSFADFFIKSKKKNTIINITLIPYYCYIVFNIISIFTHWIFKISPNGEYIRGPLYQIGYFFAIIYVVITILIASKKLHPMYTSGRSIMIINILMVVGVTLIQFFIEDIITSGIASVGGVIVIHLYIQNVSKSTDFLTGLRNRLACIHVIEEYIKKKEEFTIYVFSLRNFKIINAKLGLENGDIALKKTADYITNFFDEQIIFRYNGDQFAVLLNHNSKNAKSIDYDSIVQKILLEFDRPLKINDFSLFLEINCAKVDYPLFGQTTKELLSAIDYSFDELKENKQNNTFISDKTILLKANKRNFIQESLIIALMEEKIEVHYQPILDLKTNFFTDSEALVRIIDNQKRLIYPKDFIDLAEDTGLIIDLTYVVLKHVCRDLRQLLDTYKEDAEHLCVSVNFSYYNFLRENMPSKVLSILKEYTIPPKMIKIEITERTLISEVEIVNRTIMQLQKEGFIFELDDFGIEYSNLNALFDLRCDAVKIDRQLMLSAISAVQNTVFFENITKGMLTMGKKVIVEGAETQEHIDFIKGCKCHYVQGFVFSKPLPFMKFEEYLHHKIFGN